jgi:hypothetical protein
VLRHLIVAMSEAVVSPSPMMKEEKARSLTGRATPTRRTCGGDSGRAERPAAPAAAPAEARGGRTRRRPDARSARRRRARHQSAGRSTLTLARDPLRYTPARYPALECTLRIRSRAARGGGERRVDVEVHGVAFRRGGTVAVRVPSDHARCAAKAFSPGVTVPGTHWRCTSHDSPN